MTKDKQGCIFIRVRRDREGVIPVKGRYFNKCCHWFAVRENKRGRSYYSGSAKRWILTDIASGFKIGSYRTIDECREAVTADLIKTICHSYEISREQMDEYVNQIYHAYFEYGDDKMCEYIKEDYEF